jgi:hypothetical protein
MLLWWRVSSAKGGKHFQNDAQHDRSQFIEYVDHRQSESNSVDGSGNRNRPDVDNYRHHYHSDHNEFPPPPSRFRPVRILTATSNNTNETAKNTITTTATNATAIPPPLLVPNHHRKHHHHHNHMVSPFSLALPLILPTLPSSFTPLQPNLANLGHQHFT